MCFYNILNEGVGSRRKWRAAGWGSQSGNESVLAKSSGDTSVCPGFPAIQTGFFKLRRCPLHNSLLASVFSSDSSFLQLRSVSPPCTHGKLRGVEQDADGAVSIVYSGEVRPPIVVEIGHDQLPRVSADRKTPGLLE